MYYITHMTENTPQNRAAGLVTVQLGTALKTDWIRWCQERNLVPGKAMRQLVEKVLAEGLELPTAGQSDKAMVKVGKAPDTGQKVGREIYFTPSENAAIAAVSTSQGFGFHEWVVAAVRGALAKAPSYGQIELEVITKSNLAMIQVVFELAALRRAGDDPELAAKLATIENAIKSHVEKTSAVVAQGAQRWQLKI